MMSNNEQNIDRGLKNVLFFYIFGIITLPFSPIVLFLGWVFRRTIYKVTADKNYRKNAFLIFHSCLYILLFFGTSSRWGFVDFEFSLWRTFSAVLGCVGWYLVIHDMTQGAHDNNAPNPSRFFGSFFATVNVDWKAYADWKRRRAIQSLKGLMLLVGVILLYGIIDLIQRYP